MYVITVTFTVSSQHLDEFRVAMVDQARASLENEPDCIRFDVATDPDDATVLFLYELYSDEAAFEAHLGSAHFERFNAITSAWVTKGKGNLLPSAVTP